jgi:flavin reductase (DIM6/NTAB) family NADH-FMN oxidoreductase RutF
VNITPAEKGSLNLTTYGESKVDSMQFRQTMGLWPTGIAVLAVREGNGEVEAMTANSITSVSLEPLSVLVCVHKDAAIMPHLDQAPVYSASFLRADQQAMSDFFARRWEGSETPGYRFVEWAGGVRLDTCTGAVALRKSAIHDGGGHWIVVGEVVDLYASPDPADPLIFFGGGYRRLSGE